ncbi:hypothetical protein [Rubritalea tangerina]
MLGEHRQNIDSNFGHCSTQLLNFLSSLFSCPSSAIASFTGVR